jgi:hypothetical protein
VIDDCDYYVLIIGGRYGSLSDNGISYTEMEFDYAIAKGIKAVVLVHGDQGSITMDKSETDPLLREKLKSFIDKASSGRLVKYWKIPEDLPGIVSLSLLKTMKLYPAQGWVRAPKSTNEEVLQEINELRKRNEELVRKLSQAVSHYELASLDETFSFEITWNERDEQGWNVPLRKRKMNIASTWREIISVILPKVVERPASTAAKTYLATAIFHSRKNCTAQQCTGFTVERIAFSKIQIQLEALGLIEYENMETRKGNKAIWVLTEEGRRFMLKMNATSSGT